MKLKNLFFTLAALVCVATVSASTQENEAVASSSEPLVLSLEQALQIALSENPTVKIADQTIEAKKYAKKGTYSALWPDISASGTYQRYIKKQTFHIMGQTMQVGTTNNISGGVNAAMPLVNAQLWKSLKLSAMDVELAVEQARSSRVDMVE
jgi:outer membrane protein TolC